MSNWNFPNYPTIRHYHYTHEEYPCWYSPQYYMPPPPQQPVHSYYPFYYYPRQFQSPWPQHFAAPQGQPQAKLLGQFEVCQSDSPTEMESKSSSVSITPSFNSATRPPPSSESDAETSINHAKPRLEAGCARGGVRRKGTSSITQQNLNPVFHRRRKQEDEGELTQTMMKQARKTGILNLSMKSLAIVPEKVYNINESDKDVPKPTLDFLVANEDDAWWNHLPLTNLDLSSNTLTEISPNIEKLDSLTTLTLHDNCLTGLPKEIGKLEKLARINLSRNKLTELPREFYTLPRLRYLNLSHNKFESLSPDISSLYMLEILDMSNNELRELPAGIGFLVRLTELLLADNHIKQLPPDFIDLRNLKKLDLMHNDLEVLPKNMGNLHKLECLYIHHNDIAELPKFDGCDSLQELHASNNFLQSISKRFCLSLRHLKILDLRDNRIAELPREIGYLKNLVRLDISNNSLTKLPNSLGTLAHLVSLQIEGNPIKTIRRDVIQCGTTRILKTLRERGREEVQSPLSSSPDTDSASNPFTMGGDGLNSPRSAGGQNPEDSPFPDKYKMRKTRCLSVTMHNLSHIPDELFAVASAEDVNMVDLTKNQLQTLPFGLQMMKDCASELIFAKNQLRSIPSFISQFTRVTLINVSCNKLHDLPHEFGLLQTLRELNIANNRFEAIPSCVYELHNLEILQALDNQIRYIDASADGLGRLKRLATLNLRNNDIETVPPILGTLTNINNLDLVGNPFRQPRHQILEKGTAAIMSYLRDRIPV